MNGQEGLQKALDQIPDLVVSDLMMPVMDGVTMTNELKQNEKTSHIPIIILTAKAASESKIEGLKTGADDYLVKPFDGDELIVRIRNLVEQRQKLRELFSQKIISITPDKTNLPRWITASSKMCETVSVITLTMNFSAWWNWPAP